MSVQAVCAAAFVVLMLATALPSADIPPDAARELAQKITANIGTRDAVALEVRGLTELTPAQLTEARRTMERELRRRRVKLADKPAAAVEVVVTLSESADKQVFVAEIRRGETREVVMVSRPNNADDAPGESAARIVLEKNLIWEHSRPVLDLAVAGEDMLILEGSQLSIYRRAGERWETGDVLAIHPAKAWPRDLRGRLDVSGDEFRVYLPGVSCTGSRKPSSAIECQEAAVRWPDALDGEMAAGRNYFTAKDLDPFYSAARTADHGRVEMLVLAGVDGRTRLLNQNQEPRAIANWDGWGSDIAAVESACGGGRQVLATRPGAAAETDAVQAYEIVNLKPVAASEPVEFPGTITALWPPAGGRKALAVAWNPKTGRYAAYSLAVACSR